MRPSTLLLLAAALAAAHATTSIDDSTAELKDAPAEGDPTNGSDEASDGEHQPVVRKKRTFGDVVFRGLADVLGYSVARKPPTPAPFPPPLDPVPGIDAPLQAGPAPPPPCAAPRAAPPPCRPAPPKPRPPPPPPPPPPCPKPRAAPRPKPRPPPPPPPPPCAKPRANPATPAPCAPPAPPPPPPKDNLETITSNFRLDFNFNRNPAATPAPAPAAAPALARADDQYEQDDEQAPTGPVAIAPRAARLPPEPPRVYVDAYLVRGGGVAQRVPAADAASLHGRGAPADDDYIVYDEEGDDRAQDDDYEDAQESRDRAEAVKEFGTAVDRFWESKKRDRPRARKELPADHYRTVHFGDRALADLVRKPKKERARADRVPTSPPEAEEEDAESTTTTEDPHGKLKPRVLPPTEHNPNNIDTVTVRVPPIYKEKRPKKYHRGRTPEREEEEDGRTPEFPNSTSEESDAEGADASVSQRTERPRKRRRKPSRRTRDTHEAYSAGDYDYYGRKLPVSEEERFYMELTLPPPTKDADRARHEDPENDHFLNDHERIREDPERQAEDSEEDDDESERADENERSQDDSERTGDQGKADERERTDKLSPNAKVHLSGFRNKYVKAHNVQVDDPRPVVAAVRKKTTKIGA